ncbi:MAG: hypothetical protein AB7F19_02350 [Candidatus Babeliales bacterium]
MTLKAILLITLLSSTYCTAMDGLFQMPSRPVLYKRLTNGSTCLHEGDIEAFNLAGVLGGKKLLFMEINTRVTGAVKRHCAFLVRELREVSSRESIEKCIPDWEKTMLITILQDYEEALDEIKKQSAIEAPIK